MSDQQNTGFYRAAGELFGLLRDSLGFGELVMFTRSWGEFAGPPTVVYQWTFKAGRDDYCVEESITPELITA